MKKLVVILVVFMFLFSSVSFVNAGKPATTMTSRISAWSFQNPIEQQTPGGATQPDKSLWVINSTQAQYPTKCVWDADDYVYVEFYGNLEPGQSVSRSHCLVGDWTGHLMGVLSNSLTLDVSIQIDGLTQPVLVNKSIGRACIVGPDYDQQFTGFSSIEGSNGGLGVMHTVTWKVTNNTTRRVRNALVKGSLEWNTSMTENYYCPSKFPIASTGNVGGLINPRWYWSN